MNFSSVLLSIIFHTGIFLSLITFFNPELHQRTKIQHDLVSFQIIENDLFEKQKQNKILDEQKSVNNIEKQFPGFFDQLNAMRFNQGGAVGGGGSEGGSSSPSAGNVTVNINVSSSGESSTSGGEANDQDMAAKIKDAVVGVISQEKRVGGMLRG